MLGINFEQSTLYFKELHTERVVATQIVKDDDEGQIISRTFNVYEFKDEAKIKEVDGPPPYWVGIIPGDPETHTNRITEPINSHYIVRSSFTVHEYSGYLMYAEPIENIDELKAEGMIAEDFVDPKDINLFKGWFQKDVDMFSFDYYIPLRTGQEFRWEVELIEEEIVAPDLRPPSSWRVHQNVGTYPTDNFDDRINERVAELKEQGYTVLSTSNTGSKLDDESFEGTITAIKNIFNTGGVILIEYDVVTNISVFEIKREDTGVAIRFTIQNCKAWFSSDGVTKEDPIFVDHLGVKLLQPSVELERLKIYKYIIVQPNLPFEENVKEDLAGNEYVSYPPMKFTPQTNEGFTFIAEFIGRHYLHFKEDLDEISLPVVVASTSINLNDPKPPTNKLHDYEFISNDSGSYWDADITL